MNENKTESTMERRRDAPASIWGEIVVEPTWRPQDKPRVEESWLRVNGYLPERRQR